MFTGIIQGIGIVLGIKKLNNQLIMRIQPGFAINDFHVGESVAVNGCCLTVIKFSPLWFEAYVSTETVLRTNLKYLARGKTVNLERALKLNDRLGGHILTGHIDEIASIKKIQLAGMSKMMTLAVSKKNSKFLIEKGSVALDGISLTIASCNQQLCKVNLIPETINNTTATTWHVGYKINIEIDTLAKLASFSTKHNDKSISKDFLIEYGFC
jgi:riboflavin synthase